MAFDLIEKQLVYKGDKLRLEVHHYRDEETGERMRREIILHNGAAVIIPVLPDGRLLLVRQRRYTINQVLLELPAGTLEKNEDAMNCAGRELQEETGYLAGRLTPIGSFFSSPGISTEKIYLFVARDLEKSVAAPDVGEEIEVTPVTLPQAIEMIAHGQINDGKTIAALMMFDRFQRNAV